MQDFTYQERRTPPADSDWIKHLGALVLETNAEGYISNAWSEETALLGKAHQLYLGRYVTDLYKKTSQETLKKIQDCLTTGQPQEMNFRGSDIKDGNVRVYMRIMPCFHNPDTVLMVINYPRLEEEEIQEKTWKMAVEATGDGMWDADVKNGKVYFSTAWKNMLGYEEDEIGSESSDAMQLMHEEDVEPFRAALDAHLAGKTPFLYQEHRMRAKDGSYKWLLSRGRILTTDEKGQAVRFVGIDVDITKSKAVTESLRTVNETFLNAFHRSSIGMALVSPEGNWLEVNESLCKLLGYSQEEFTRMTFQDITYPDDLYADMHFVGKMLNKEVETYSMEKRYISKSHRIVWALLSVSLVWNKDGSPKFFVSQVIDITHKKEMDHQLHQQNEKLLVTTKELEEKLVRLEELNYMIAHNLRGPVGNISMIINSIKNNEGIFSFDESLEHIITSSDALISSLNTLMEFGNIKLNKTIKYDDCYVSEVVENIKKQLHSIIFQKQAVIEVNAYQPVVHYPKQYLESIIYNLISNALKYSHEDTPPHITITVSADKGKTTLKVADNGIGMDLEKMGDKLFKLNGILHHGYDSKGLGLFLTKTQIESLGGTISASSEVGKGTEFTVVLQ